MNDQRYGDDDLLMISALQHILFCERQCALIHVEQIWDENVFTTRGEIMHAKAHEGGTEYRDGVRIERGVPLRSNALGLVGKSDVVEFHKDENGALVPFPVEYKLGKPKSNKCDEVQLCAQAICLEEMLDVHIPAGALFYGKTKRRMDVVFDSDLRAITADAAERLRQIVEGGITPPAVYDKRKCDNCSLLDMCLPKKSGLKDAGKSAAEFIEEVLNEETS